MSYQDREFEIQEVQAGNKIISHFIDNCIQNFTILDLEEVRDRHKLFADQFAFWLQQNDTKRLMIDTREFAQWLCEKIADVSKKNVDIGE
tara:strand:- start:479 stop:748 length:270 start_codon:yes stop_codon:yes gene_type:complete